MGNKLPGGKGDKKKPSDFDPKEVSMGTKEEMEHTDNKSIATEIALDHLSEDPKYYSKYKAAMKADVRVDQEADGKRELDVGHEELEKPGVPDRRFSESSTPNTAATPNWTPKSDVPFHVAASAPLKDPAWKRNLKNSSKLGKEESPKKQKAQYQGKWYAVNNIVDDKKPRHEGGGNYYHLEGVKNPVHQNEIEDLDLGEVSKMEQRWSDLRKAIMREQETTNTLDNTSAIPDLFSDKDDSAAAAQPDTPKDPGDSQEQPEESSPDQEEPSQDDSQQEDDTQSPGNPEEPNIEEIIQHLKDLGHSDQEIAYIVHGHVPPHASLEYQQSMGEMSNDQREADAEHEHGQNLKSIELTHEQAMKQLEQERAKLEMQSMDPEYQKDHSKRMLDLEYEMARKERELEIEFKRKELELKMKAKAAAHKEKSDGSEKAK